MTDLFQEPDDATPLKLEERDGLLQTWITDRDDLNEAEQENIVKGAAWARRRRGSKAADLLNDEYVKTLHKQMFGDVWKWAGAYRLTERNIGIKASRIPTDMPGMLNDVRYWVEHSTYPPRRDRRAFASPSDRNSPVSQWQRPACADDGRSADRKSWRAALQLGRRQPRWCRRAASEVRCGPQGGRRSRHRAAARFCAVVTGCSIRICPTECLTHLNPLIAGNTPSRI